MPKTHKIKKLSADYVINSGTDIWIFTKSASRVSEGTVLTEQGTIGSRVTIQGHFISSSAGVASYGVDFSLTLDKSSKIETEGTALGLYGDDARVVAKGLIDGGAYYAVSAEADGFSLTNSGRIVTTGHGYGVVTRGDDVDVVNNTGGKIVSGSPVYLNTEYDESARLVNHGTIKAVGANANAVTFGDGTGRLINDGTIDGVLLLGGGETYVDTRGGKLTVGAVRGGAGNDTLVTDNADYYIDESHGGGTDTIKSTVSYVMNAVGAVENLVLLGSKNINLNGAGTAETLLGNAGNNKIHGMGGQDRIEGRKGNDRLWGEDGSDSFVFNNGSGTDKVMDFTHGIDKIVFDPWHGIATYQEVLDHASFKGGDVTIKAGKDEIVLVGITQDEIASDDFTFGN